MNTLEMFTMLFKYTDKKFIRKKDGLEMTIDDSGFLSWKSGCAHLNANDEWSEFSKDVPFLTAVTALLRGDDILCEWFGAVQVFRHACLDLGMLLALHSLSYWGKWYILEKEKV
jgi:hypothetical protein